MFSLGLECFKFNPMKKIMKYKLFYFIYLIFDGYTFNVTVSKLIIDVMKVLISIMNGLIIVLFFINYFHL